MIDTNRRDFLADCLSGLLLAGLIEGQITRPPFNGVFSNELFGNLSAYYRAYAGLFQLSNGTTAATADNDPVGYWTDQSGSGRHVIQATSGNRPLLQTALPSILFDGVNDNLKFSGALSDTTGAIVCVFKTPAAFSAAMVLVSSADEGSTNNWFEFGIDSEGRMYVETNNAGTKLTILSPNWLEVSTVYFAVLDYDGTDYYLGVNGIEENPLVITNIGTYGWFSGVTGADNLTLGCTVTSAGIVRPFSGELIEIAIYNKDIT